jgi:nitrogen fixation protein
MTIKVTYNVTDVYVTQDVSPVYINVSYSSGGGGGAAVWGGITGTLSDQTDLQTALDLKVPYTGATQDVNLGEYEIKAGQVTLDTSPTGTAAVGTTRWNDTTGLTETTLKGGSVILKNGVDLVARVVNKVSPNTTLTKAAYQAVRVSGAQGQRLAVALAQANNDANSADTIGLVTETIATNQEGFIMTVGQLENINTTGSLQGETWVDGDVLYLSPTIAGAITKVKPTGNGHIVVIGYVEYAHANNGKIYVKVMNGWELDELHDVAIVTPLNNEALIYESSSALWKNKSIATALGYTPANAATTLTINGVTYDLSTSRTWSVGSVTGSGASGQVAYWTGTSAQSGSNNLFWDNANGRLGIGTNTPATPLHIGTSTNSPFGSALIYMGRDQNDETNFQISNSTSGTSARVGFRIFGANARSSYIQEFSSSHSFTEFASHLVVETNDPGQKHGIILSIPNTSTGSDLMFYSGGRASTNKKLTLFNGGNLLLQSGGTHTDSGERLQVTGTMKVTGDVSVNVNTLFVNTANQRIGVRTATPSAGIDVWNNGTTEVAQFRVSDSRISIPSYSSTGFNPTLTSSTCGFFAPSSSSVGGVQFAGFTTNSASASPFVFVGHHGSNAPTIAALRFIGFKHDGSTNRTALTGNEIIAGFSAGFNADVFQVKANGRINMSSLPTSSTGLATGDLWNDAGTIKMV